jgi:FAD/FMN-containing dehydrogenase
MASVTPVSDTLSSASAAVEALKATVRGEVLYPADEGYDTARRIWNGMIDRRPVLIVRCAGVADVINAVNFARATNLLLSVRGGGHNIAGTAVCEGGLMIDLSPMTAVRVDPASRTVRVEPGVLLGQLDHETQQFGLVVPAGVVSHTGLAGLTLGGGFGWLSRKFGLSVDHLRSVDVVTADGRLITASAERNADLFWGIRGGGSNFGIVTSFEFQLERVGPTVLAGMAFFPMEEAHDVLRRYRDYANAAPDDVTTIVSLRIAPPMPFLPEHVHGRKVVGVGACYVGDPDSGEAVIAPLRRLGTLLADVIAPKPFIVHQQTFDPTVPHFNRYYWKSHDLPPLSDAAIDTMIRYAWRAPSPLSYTIMFQLGAAVGRIGEEETAYGGRDAAHAVNINSNWTDPGADAENIAWAREFFEAMQPFSTGGVYVNFLGNEGEDRVRAAYGGEKYERLVALKNKYDPTNLFRVNQNIKPTAA